jgi:hypothetical protein
LELWDTEAFLDELKEMDDGDASNMWFPQKGYTIKFNQKNPKMELFSSIYEPAYSYVMFANKNTKGEKNILFSIKIHE